jgi:hypothetical protein
VKLICKETGEEVKKFNVHIEEKFRRELYISGSTYIEEDSRELFSRELIQINYETVDGQRIFWTLENVDIEEIEKSKWMRSLVYYTFQINDDMIEESKHIGPFLIVKD